MTIGLIIRDGTNTPRAISELFIRDGAGTSREISELWIRDENNVPRLVFNPSGSMTLEVTTNVDFVSGVSTGTGTATTGSVTATATGGTPPYTYLWTLIEYDASPPPTAGAPTSVTTTFTQTGLPPNTAYGSTWAIVVADDNGITTFTNINANFADSS